MKYSGVIGPFLGSFRVRSSATPALLIRMSIWKVPDPDPSVAPVVAGLEKFCFACVRIFGIDCSGLLRSACTLSHFILYFVDSVSVMVSVLVLLVSEVYTSNKEQPFSARLWAIASPIPIDY